MPRAICAPPCRPSRRRRASRHDRLRHHLVDPQQLSGAAGDGIYHLRRRLCRAAHGTRRHSGSLRHSGHRLHRISRPGAAGYRGSGHLSADHGAARGAALQGGARLLLLRRVLRLCRIRGRHRSLLGALARLEYLNFAAKRLPEGITPSLGPDATGVGWVYQYVVLGAQRTLAELRTIQDWYLRYQLTKAEGVAEVASVGGFVQQYQVVVDPQKLQAYGLTLAQLTNAIRASNRDVGGRVVEMSETEYVVRGRGYLRNTKDLEEIALKMQGGTPVLLRDVARIELGPEERRGIAELNGQGEVVSGIALQRDGQNALRVIDSVKQKLAEIAPSLTKGVTVEAVYDRSDLIHRAIETLKHTLTEESIIVALVCIVFLLHVRSALVAILMLPVGVLIAMGLLHVLGLSSNIMSLGGIAIALGAMVDAAIVMIENAHKHLERAAPGTSRAKILTDAALEVGPALL